MTVACKNQEADKIFHLNCNTALEISLLSKKRNFFFRRAYNLFKRVKIDQKALREILEITFWK